MAFKCQRWTVANILPVIFILGMIGAIWGLYMWLHLLPLLAGEAGNSCSAEFDTMRKVSIVSNTLQVRGECIKAAVRRGAIEAVIQQLLTVMVLICFGRAIFTDPGTVPDIPEWMPESRPYIRGPEEIGPDGKSDSERKPPKQYELKHTGARRFCKWCNRFKPDRAHHCRVCRSCILRMDHHCPWIANCVGFHNHKYFFLLVLYSLVDCVFVATTVSESLQRSLVEETKFSQRFLLVFCMTLSTMMAVLLVLFFLMHSRLMLQATTTIEYCEKNYRHSGRSHGVSAKSLYDLGLLGNMRAVLGSNMLLWFLPLAPPDGDGLSFKVLKAMENDNDSDVETTALLPKHGQQGDLPKGDNSAGILAYQSISKDDVKSGLGKNIDVVNTSTSVPKIVESFTALGKHVEGNEAAPEVTPGDASIS